MHFMEANVDIEISDFWFEEWWDNSISGKLAWINKPFCLILLFFTKVAYFFIEQILFLIIRYSLGVLQPSFPDSFLLLFHLHEFFISDFSHQVKFYFFAASLLLLLKVINVKFESVSDPSNCIVNVLFNIRDLLNKVSGNFLEGILHLSID